jgi:hypothetical protein
MTPTQARNLLALIADLYALASTPDPQPQPEAAANGKAKEPAKAAP